MPQRPTERSIDRRVWVRFDILLPVRAALVSRSRLVSASWIAGFACLAGDPDGDQPDMSWRDEGLTGSL